MDNESNKSRPSAALAARRAPAGIHDPTGPGKLLFAFFATMEETEREDIREPMLEGLATAAREGKHGGRPQAHADFAAIQVGGVPGPLPALPDRAPL
jgi:hypothetical protein